MERPPVNCSHGCRYAAIDGFRFIAAMGVVAHHYSGFAGVPAAEALFAKNYLFVDFFFAISGFVIFHNYGSRVSSWASYGDFLRNRIARIYPLHFLTFLVFAGLAVTVWRDKPDRAFIDPAAVVPNLLLIHAWGTTQSTAFNYPSWSISAEWFAYLSFPAVAWLIRRGGARAGVLAAAAIVFLLEAAGYLDLIGPWTTLNHDFGALRVLPTFLLGAALAHGAARIPLTFASFAPAWLAFLGAIAAMAMGLDDHLILILLMAVVGAAVIAERNGAKGLLTRPRMARLGDLSYAVYMIHPLMAALLINFAAVKILHLSGAALALWCLICAIVPNVLGAAVIHRFAEVPARDWLRHLRFPGRARANEQTTFGAV